MAIYGSPEEPPWVTTDVWLGAITSESGNSRKAGSIN
jgi:hypothetical protein